MPRDRLARRAVCSGVCSAVLLLTLPGCPPQDPVRTGPVIESPLDLPQAIEHVNQHNEAIVATVQARAGHARGYFHDRQGRRRNYDLDAAVLLYPPRCLRMDLTLLGKSQLLFGSNEDRYWVVHPNAHVLSFGRHDQINPPKIGDLPIRPDLLVEAVGFNTLPTETTGVYGPIARVDDLHQDLLFLEYDEHGQAYIAREYWISRRPGRQLERIVFRDSDGKIIMDSRLGNYRPVDGAPALPHRIEIAWPATRSAMLFTTAGWRLLPNLTPDAPSFTFPVDRGEEFSRIIDVDEEVNDLPFSLPEAGTDPPVAD